MNFEELQEKVGPVEAQMDKADLAVFTKLLVTLHFDVMISTLTRIKAFELKRQSEDPGLVDALTAITASGKFAQLKSVEALMEVINRYRAMAAKTMPTEADPIH